MENVAVVLLLFMIAMSAALNAFAAVMNFKSALAPNNPLAPWNAVLGVACIAGIGVLGLSAAALLG